MRRTNKCSDGRPGYRYQQLNYRDSEIRLIKIEERGSNATQPVCFVRHFSLDRAPPYKALSYRWGDNHSFHEISIDGQPLGVSKNLYDFLSQGASPEEPERPKMYTAAWTWEDYAEERARWVSNPWLWIDQVCIDQSNLKEKNRQVSQMGVIFGRALEVLVWLGDGKDGTETAVRDLASDVHASYQSGCSPTSVQALQKIATNEYWTRLWIIQEFLLARSFMIMSGTAQIAGTRLGEMRDIISFRESKAISHLYTLVEMRWGTFPSCVRDQETLPHDKPHDAVIQHNLQQTKSWSDILWLGKRAECVDIRDRVYGLLSMLKPEARVDVDYNATAWQIREKVKKKEFFIRFHKAYPGQARDALSKSDYAFHYDFLRTLDSALGLDHITTQQLDSRSKPWSNFRYELSEALESAKSSVTRTMRLHGAR